MDRQTALALNELNARFYQTVHQSFSATRNSAWQGWDRLADLLEAEGFGSSSAVSILDVACGNMRFERYLADRFPGANFEFHGVDNCPQLADPNIVLRFDEIDLIQNLVDDVPLLGAGACSASQAGYDLVVSFGFLHHVPGAPNRLNFLHRMVQHVKPGGLLTVSLWRFMANDKLASKARAVRDQIACADGEVSLLQNKLEEGDYLLSWQDNGDVYRYCHHFEECELDRLVEELPSDCILLDRYFADGRDGQLNTYLILKRLEISKITS